MKKRPVKGARLLSVKRFYIPILVLSFMAGFVLGTSQVLTDPTKLAYLPDVLTFIASDPVDVMFFYASILE